MDWIITCRIQHYPVSQSVRSLFSKCALLVVLSNPINTCRQRHSGLLLLLQQLLAGQVSSVSVSPRPQPLSLGQVRSGAWLHLHCPFDAVQSMHAFICWLVLTCMCMHTVRGKVQLVHIYFYILYYIRIQK